MTIEAASQAICDQPDDDEARLNYADLIESSDSDHAAFIRLEVELVRCRRLDLPFDSHKGQAAGSLLRRNEQRWSRDLARFLPRSQELDGSIFSSGLFFDRGFPAQISIHPHVFLEYADLLFRLAPIRHVRFCEPYDQETLLPGPVPTRPDGSLEPIPLEQILAMPQLSRLDSFGFDMHPHDHGVLPKDTWAQIARCPHLTRCLALDAGRQNLIFDWDLETLAAGSLTGKMLRIASGHVTSTINNLGECQVFDVDSEHGEHTRTIFQERGRELEDKQGYIPWLHPSHCKQELTDLAYFVEQGVLPKYPPGTRPMKEWYEFDIEVHRYQPNREW